VRLILATTNRGKIAEIRALLQGLPIELKGVADLPLEPPAETGRTFAENARLKARFYATSTGLMAAADDSGLEIDALDGAPGLESARFNGASYEEKFRTIQALLRERHAAESPARFVCAVALARGPDILFETEATVEGRVAPTPSGTGGFGYDPIFYYPPYGRTLAEVSFEEKAAVSHRGKAFRALREYLAARLLEDNGSLRAES